MPKTDARAELADMSRLRTNLALLSLAFLAAACEPEKPPAQVSIPPALPAASASAATASAASASSSSTKAGAPNSMVSIPAGTFTMGSAANVGESNERPAHSVKVAAFSIDRTEVTVAAYEGCVRAGACTPALTPTDVNTEPCNAGRKDRKDHPINCVDWQQASAYCAWAGERLPTEEEWEYAARGSDQRTYPWGEEPNAHGDRLCCGAVPGPDLGTCPVGSHPRGASPFGVQDMAGSVGEWTSSNYSDAYGGPTNQAQRVVRGGEWDTCILRVHRSASRGGEAPTHRDSLTGFRCAR